MTEHALETKQVSFPPGFRPWLIGALIADTSHVHQLEDFEKGSATLICLRPAIEGTAEREVSKVCPLSIQPILDTKSRSVVTLFSGFCYLNPILHLINCETSLSR